MAVNKHKSRKRSVANASSPADALVFFTDADLGRRIVPEALRAAGEEVKVHDELFSPGMGDRVWLGVAGEKQRIVLTQDSRIRYHRSTTVELLAAGVRAFALVGRNLTGKEMGSIFVKALPEIKALCQTKSAPFIAHVYSDGRVLLKAGSRGGKIHR